MKTSIQTGTAKLADGATCDNAETKFLDWRELPEDIAVLPELTSPSTARLDAHSAVRSGAEDGGIASRRDRHTLGGVQMDLRQALVRKSQSPRDGGTKAENDSLWRNAA